MNNFPPYKIFLSFVLVFLCVALFLLLNPGDKYRIKVLVPETTKEGGGLIKGRSPRPPEISGVIVHPADEPVTRLEKITPADQSEYPDFISPRGIEYPNGDENILIPFIESIKGIEKEGSQTRILYFGDSQIEGDRITKFVRKRLQSEYGGSGPGMLPLMEPVYVSISLEFQQSSNWKKYDYLVNQQPSSTQGMGTMLSYSVYEGSEANLSISLKEEQDIAGRYFNCLRLILIPGSGEGVIRYSSSSTAIREWIVPSGSELVQFQFSFPSIQSELRLEFDNLAGAKMMGLSLESTTGVLVDNIAHRGSAGLEFSRDGTGSFREMANFLDPDLVVLQFGINVVPAKSNDFAYYGAYLAEEIRFLQEQIPGVPILIVGVSDMGQLVKGIPTGYLSVEKVNEVQRETARQTGSAFFDLLAFMGGAGSFKEWMDAEPILMRRDFTHFSHAGGAYVAEGIAQALIGAVERSNNPEDNGI